VCLFLPSILINEQCRSICWNSSGSHLASASHNDRLTKLWSFSRAGAQESGTLTGHDAAVERVRFHPHDPNLICTSAEDKSIRLWDLRQSRSCVGRIDLKSRMGACAASLEWHPGQKSLCLVVAEKDNAVHVYDVRNMRGIGAQRGGGGRVAPQAGGSSQVPVRSFRLDPHTLQETHFSPSGTHLISAARRAYDGMGVLKIYPWDSDSSNIPERSGDSLDVNKHAAVFVGHTGPIYTLRFAPNGQTLATGGADALVGLWDVPSMVCKTTIGSRAKFIRSVSFSHDSKIVAYCSEEEGVDLADGETGVKLGTVTLSPTNSGGGNRRVERERGSDEIAFHPKLYALACARGDCGSHSPQVTIASLTME